MKPKLRKLLSMLLALCLLAVFSPVGMTPALAAGEVCEINGTQYATLDDALNAVLEGGATATTINLLQDIDYAGGITVVNKKIIFDLNGKTLSVNNTTGSGITVTNGSVIDITNPGAFNVTGSEMGLSASNSTIKVTNVNSSTSHGINVSNNSNITVTNDVISASSMAVAASGGSEISIGGNVSGANYGVYAQDVGTAITVAGNVSTTGNNSYGAHSRGGATVTIHSNVTATGSNSIGANLNTGGTLTVDGIITAQSYIVLGTVVKTAADITTLTTKPGYNTYTDPNDTSTVWVKAANVAEIGATQYATLDEALAAVTDGQTITLLSPIDYNQGISITDGRNIIFNLNSFNLNIASSGGDGLTVTNGSVGYTGAGAFNVSGASFGVNVNGSNASATVTNATAFFPGSCGAYASNGGSITIDNNVEGGYAGAYAGANSNIVVSGDAVGNGADSYGANATGNGSIVTVQGNAIGTGASSFGAGAYQGGSVIIEGNAQGVLYGVNAVGVVNSVKSSVAVSKNVTASDELNGIGALTAAGGKITIEGTITAKNYIKIYLTLMYESPVSRTLPSTKEGYHTYSDGFSVVWVLDTSAPPTGDALWNYRSPLPTPNIMENA